ncbi:protein-lysine N-methyltransferase EEF2KMT [Rana temporaria]|uniref:protein-lysine N-methyltransferase EEF2KMT n=1 Tax=Rana temporaria TaxID=8407 RepID=UPI001AACBFE1|nr:protein-lysine N-methyltransferase EEF2KMT [Rana temporaria]
MDITENTLCDAFQRYFFCCRQIGSLPWQDLAQQQPSLILKILEKTVNHPLCRSYPPSLQYRRLFLLELIKKHESTEAEPQDELYNALADVLNTEQTTKCHKSYFLPSGGTVTLCESTAIISEGTTGLVTWDAALFLAEWAIENVDIFRNRTVLELGSGIGLTGLVICKSCFPKKYMFSDCHQKVLSKLRENIHLNGFVLTDEDDYTKTPERVKDSDTVQMSVLELDWESIKEQQLSHIDADVIIAADVVYDPDVITSFSNILCKLLLCKKVEKRLHIFVASTVRNSETYKLFQTKLDEAGLKWQIVANHKKNIFVYDANCTIHILRVSI